MVLSDIRNNAHASQVLWDEEEMRSAVLVPILVDDEVLGTISVLSRAISRFDGGDVMLIGAAASQIGLAARQANLLAAYRGATLTAIGVDRGRDAGQLQFRGAFELGHQDVLFGQYLCEIR